MKKLIIILMTLLLIIIYSHQTFANTWLAGPLAMQLEHDNLNWFVEYTYESYNLEHDYSYTGGIFYKIFNSVSLEASFTLNKEVPKVYSIGSVPEEFQDDLNTIYPKGYTNFSMALGDIGLLMLLAQYTYEDETSKIGLFRSFKLSKAENYLLLGGGVLSARKIAGAFEESPFGVIEFRNEQTYCRLQYIAGITPEIIHSGFTTDGLREISWVLAIGYTF